MDQNNYIDFARLIEEAIETAESINEIQVEIKRHEDSVTILKSLNKYEQEHTKLESVIDAMQTSIKPKRIHLKNTENKWIKQVVDELENAADVDSKLNKLDILSDNMDVDSIFDIKPYLLEANHLKEEADKLISTKADKLSFIEEIDNTIDQSRTELTSFMDNTILNCQVKEAQTTATLNKLKRSVQEFGRRDIRNEVFNELLGTTVKAPLKEDAVTHLANQAVRDILGEKLLEQVVHDHTIRSSIVSSLQVRKPDTNEETKHEIDAMKEEADEALALLTKAESLSNSIEILDYADHIIRNHASVLKFINAPDGIVNDIPYEGDAENIPPGISLHRKNSNLSNALATSIVQRTKKFYFSDLEERLAKLEEQMIE